MKTYYFSNGKLSIYSMLGLMAFLIASCGSYQNGSYYDHDGIYGNTQKDRNNSQAASQTQENSQNTHYKDYFSSLQNEQAEIFTDVDNYTSAETNPQGSPEYNTGYSGWGNDSDNVTVNVYGNNWGYWNDYWYGGPYWGLGWNSWYGPSWSIGWGWGSWYGPGWGWGWNNYYAPYYGCNNYYYGNGIHHSFYGNNQYTYQTGKRGDYYNGTRGGRPVRNYSNSTRSYTHINNGTRNTTFTNTRNNTRNTPQNTAPRPNNTYSNPRGNDVRQTTPTRSYSPSYNNGGGGNRGGGYSGGGSRSGGRR